MSDAKSNIFNILLFSFQGASTAGELAKDAKAANLLEGYSVIARAIVERDANGKVHIHEPGHGGIGGTIGAVAGGLAGLLAGPVGVLALAITGGLVGGVAGHFAGREIPTDDLKDLAAALPPDSSAVVVLVEDTEAEKVIDGMKDFNANVVTVTVGDELSGTISSLVAGEITGGAADAGASAAAAATGGEASGPAPTAAADAPGAEKPAADAGSAKSS